MKMLQLKDLFMSLTSENEGIQKSLHEFVVAPFEKNVFVLFNEAVWNILWKDMTEPTRLHSHQCCTRKDKHALRSVVVKLHLTAFNWETEKGTFQWTNLTTELHTIHILTDIYRDNLHFFFYLLTKWAKHFTKQCKLRTDSGAESQCGPRGPGQV